MKILLHSNAPWYPSGYGQQVALFAPRLARHSELAISAFYGHQGGRLKWAGLDVYPALGGTHGNECILGHAESFFSTLRGGLVLTLMDVPPLETAIWRNLDVACWVPLDHDPAPPAVRTFFAETAAIPIAISRFAQDRLRGFDALYVPHGVDTAVFSPRPQAEARARLGLPVDAFVVGAVAMNKGYPSRKSLPQIVEAFAAFRARHDEAILYLHTDIGGAYQGGVDLPVMLGAFGLDPQIVRFPDQYRYQFDPFTTDHMADVYSAIDVLLNPSMGEGFGLPVLEAQACGVPAIVTDFTAMSEVCGAGWKVGYDRVWTPMRAWMAWPRVDEVIDSLEQCYSLSAQDRAELAANARQHALLYDADRVMEEHWLPALAEVERRLADRRPLRIAAKAA